MEGISIADAKAIFGDYFIGPDEIEIIATRMGICSVSSIEAPVPEIQFSISQLQEASGTHILFLAVPFQTQPEKKISINFLREVFGMEPAHSEPCLYNQDWYINEEFAKTCTIAYKWYLVRREVLESSRSVIPVKNADGLPSALLLAYLFFSYWLLRNVILFQYDFVWCSDTDANNDQVYVGRYLDPKGVAKNGFSVHRFLSLTYNYGSVV